MIPTSKLVQQIGKYLYNNLDTAYKFKVSPNTYEVYLSVPYVNISTGEISEILINLNITTYLNKIRVNTIEMTPKERTLGFDVYEPEIASNIDELRKIIMKKVYRRLENAYRPNYRIIHEA